MRLQNTNVGGFCAGKSPTKRYCYKKDPWIV